MTTENHHIIVSGINVEIVRKDIKNLHLGVYPPHGRVRVAAPLVIDDDAVRLAVIDKLRWIRRQRTRFAEQPRQSSREMVNGESHYFLGRRYRLRVTEHEGAAMISVRGVASLDVYARAGDSAEQREAALQRWYRAQLKTILTPLISKWESKLKVKAAYWGVRRMKTKWGSCNVDARRLSFNLELAKKSPTCIEYIVAHEFLHLLERGHGDRFVFLMNKHLPGWQAARNELNAAPLAHEEWV